MQMNKVEEVEPRKKSLATKLSLSETVKRFSAGQNSSQKPLFKCVLKYEAIYEHQDIEDSFLLFLKTEMNSDPLEFIREYKTFNDITKEVDKVVTLRRILNDYIFPNGPKELNISGKVRKDILYKLKNSGQLDSVNWIEKTRWVMKETLQEIFSEVYKNIKNDLEIDSYGRFIESPLWKSLEKTYQDNETVCDKLPMYDMEEEETDKKWRRQNKEVEKKEDKRLFKFMKKEAKKEKEDITKRSSLGFIQKISDLSKGLASPRKKPRKFSSLQVIGKDGSIRVNRDPSSGVSNPSSNPSLNTSTKKAGILKNLKSKIFGGKKLEDVKVTEEINEEDGHDSESDDSDIEENYQEKIEPLRKFNNNRSVPVSPVSPSPDVLVAKKPIHDVIQFQKTEKRFDELTSSTEELSVLEKISNDGQFKEKRLNKFKKMAETKKREEEREKMKEEIKLAESKRKEEEEKAIQAELKRKEEEEKLSKLRKEEEERIKKEISTLELEREQKEKERIEELKKQQEITRISEEKRIKEEKHLEELKRRQKEEEERIEELKREQLKTQKLVEEKRQQEEARLQEEKRKDEEFKKKEEERLAAEIELINEKRKLEEEKIKLASEERSKEEKKLEELRKLYQQEEEKVKNAAQKRQQEEIELQQKKKKEEEDRMIEIQKKQKEELKQAEERKKQEEERINELNQRLKDEEKKLEKLKQQQEAYRLAEQERAKEIQKLHEENRKLVEQQRKAEELRLQELKDKQKEEIEKIERLKKEHEKVQQLAEEKRKKEEIQKQEQERISTQKKLEEEELKISDEMRKKEEERILDLLNKLKQEEEKVRLAEEKRKKEDEEYKVVRQRRKTEIQQEEERLMKIKKEEEERQRIASENRKKEEERLLEEARIADEKRKMEERRIEEMIKKQKENRLAEEARIQKLKQEEEEEKQRLEKLQKMRQEAAKKEAELAQEFKRKEKEIRDAEEARIEKLRKKLSEERRVEKERLEQLRLEEEKEKKRIEKQLEEFQKLEDERFEKFQQEEKIRKEEKRLKRMKRLEEKRLQKEKEMESTEEEQQNNTSYSTEEEEEKKEMFEKERANKLHLNLGLTNQKDEENILEDDEDEDVEDSEKETQRNPELAREYLSEGVQLIKSKNWEDAVDKFTLAIDHDEILVEAYFNRGILNYNREKYLATTMDMYKVISLDPTMQRAFSLRGMALKKLEKWDLAIKDFVKSFEHEVITNNYMLLGICYDQVNKTEEAIKAYSNFIDKVIEDTDAKQEDLSPINQKNLIFVFCNRALDYCQTREFKKSLKDYSKALKLCQNEDQIREIKGMRSKCHKIFGNEDAAKEDLKESLTDVEHYNNGFEEVKQKNYEIAYEHFTNAIDQNTQNWNYYYGRSLCSKNMKKYEDCVLDLKIAIKLNPESVKALQLLVKMYIQIERFSKALKTYEKLIELEPTANNYFSRANLLCEIEGKEEEALYDYKMAIEKNPNLYTAYFNRGLLYFQCQNYKKALKDFNITIENDPENSNAHVDRGLCHYYMKNKEEAIKDFKKAKKLNPENKRAINILNDLKK